MTRITNFGRKRTYLEAGFAPVDTDEGRGESQSEVVSKPENEAGNLPKKARKRRRKKMDVAVHSEEPINKDQAHTIVEEDKPFTSKQAISGEERRLDEEHTKGMHYYRLSAALSVMSLTLRSFRLRTQKTKAHRGKACIHNMLGMSQERSHRQRLS